ncbi:unnamed protein product [Dicrocoelium dendriticum]|nr:unnamed protein product [Dicrocoelium dendriticum]
MVHTRRSVRKEEIAHTHPDKDVTPRNRNRLSLISAGRKAVSKQCVTKLTVQEAKEKSSENSSNEFIIGREKEISHIHEFIRNSMETRHSCSMYVSGSPGTGKTAVVSYVTNHLGSYSHCRVLFINCMNLSSASEVFTRIFESLSQNLHGKENRGTVGHSVVEATFEKFSNLSTFIVILDELDQLYSKSKAVLYRIFNWPATLSCHLIIIGIANALDLPERLLPRLQSKAHQPKHLTFSPYSHNELADIVSAKLSAANLSGNDGVRMDPLAIQLCARKISASTGDARTALSVVSRAFDLAKQPSSSATSTPRSGFPTLKHISLALQESQNVHAPLCVGADQSNNSATPNAHLAHSLPLHHRLVMASAYLINKRKHTREFSFNQLRDVYLHICANRQLIGLEESELATVCGLLDARGHIDFSTNRGSSKIPGACAMGTPAHLHRIRLRLDDRSVEQLLTEDMLFSSILNLTLPP